MTWVHFSVLLTFIPLATATPPCGLTPIPPNINSNIMGGEVAVPYSWPWQVVWCVEEDGLECNFHCGGSIIGSRWVMTAGHCIYTRKIHKVRSGVFDKRNDTDTVLHHIKNITRHPKYSFPKDDSAVYWDIAIAELTEDITFNDHTQPVCLPSTDEDVIKDHTTAWATGFGDRKNPGWPADVLHQVNLPFINYTACEDEYKDELNSTAMICAGSYGNYTSGKDVGRGDSGGPLVVKNIANKWYQYGITSFGNSFGEDITPGIYSRVTEFCDFIESTTRGDVTCSDPNA